MSEDPEMRLRVMHSIVDLISVFSIAFSMFWAVQLIQAKLEIERTRAALDVADRFIALCLNQRTFVYGGPKGVGVKCSTM